MNTIIKLSLSLLLLALPSCEQAGYIEKAKYDKVVQENGDLKKPLADREEEIKKTPCHHYSLHREGFRTFRFDADTGETCIELTSPEDWKSKDTKAQSCQCTDIFADGNEPGELVRKISCGF